MGVLGERELQCKSLQEFCNSLGGGLSAARKEQTEDRFVTKNMECVDEAVLECQADVSIGTEEKKFITEAMATKNACLDEHPSSTRMANSKDHRQQPEQEPDAQPGVLFACKDVPVSLIAESEQSEEPGVLFACKDVSVSLIAESEQSEARTNGVELPTLSVALPVPQPANTYLIDSLLREVSSRHPQK